MCDEFECFVEISDQKYDIVIKDMGFSIKFCDIYPKVKQIVKIALHEDITFITHKFEIFEYMCQSVNGSVVQNSDEYISHKSRIRISRKPQLQSIASTLTSTPSGDQFLNLVFPKEETYLLNNIRKIKAYHSIVMAINIGWDLSYDSNNWEKVYSQLKTDVFDINNTTSYCLTTFYHWTGYYAKNFLILNGRIRPQTQQIFDLLKIVHILDLDKLFDKTNSLLTQLEIISKLPESIDFQQKYLNDIRIEKILTKESILKQEKNKTNHNLRTNNSISSIDQCQKASASASASASANACANGYLIPKIKTKEIRSDRSPNPQNIISKVIKKASNTPVLTSKEKELIENYGEIKDYLSIVTAINIGWDLREARNWNKVCTELCHMNQNIYRKEYHKEKCRATFLKWTLFYLMNFSKLEGKIVPKAQKIFDLLKIVHILDLTKIYQSNLNPIITKIDAISKRPEIKSYFDKHLTDLHLKKLESKEVEEKVKKRKEKKMKKKKRASHSSSPPMRYSHHRSVVSQSKRRSKERDNRNERHQSPVTLIREESQLKRDENEIKDYYQIVLAINIGWDFTESDQNWQKVSQTINLSRFTDVYCNNKFYFWTRFYSKTCDKWDNILEPSAQKIYDLLKVVHTLKLYKFDISEQTEDRIEKMFAKDSFRVYFSKYLSEISDIKVESKEDKLMVKAEEVSEQHLNAYIRLLNKYIHRTQITESTQNTDKPLPKATVINSSETTVPKSSESQFMNPPNHEREVQNNVIFNDNMNVLQNRSVSGRPFSQVLIFKPFVETEKKSLSCEQNLEKKQNESNSLIPILSSIGLKCNQTIPRDPRLRKKTNSVDSVNSCDTNSYINGQQIDVKPVISSIDKSLILKDPRFKIIKKSQISEDTSIGQQIDENSSNSATPLIPTQSPETPKSDPRLKSPLKRSFNKEEEVVDPNSGEPPHKKRKPNIELICLD